MFTHTLLGIKMKRIGMCAKFSTAEISESAMRSKFETVFSFPYIKHLAVFNRLKTYHILGSSVAVPACGILEILNILPQHSFLSAAYIGITGAGVLSLASLPFNNTIGFLYISEDNRLIKISSVNFWGKRVDKIVDVDDWVPLFDVAPSMLDMLFLSPRLSDNTKYKWFVKYGNVINSKKIGEVLE